MRPNRSVLPHFAPFETNVNDKENPIRFTVQGLRLSGVLHLPENPPTAVVIGCHGLLADKNSPKQIALARVANAIGMAYFRFDHRGRGESQGDFETVTTVENRKLDLLAAVETIKRKLGARIPVGLFGSSLGGTICLTTARHVSPFSIVTLAAPIRSRTIRLPEGSPESLVNEIDAKRLTFDVTAQVNSVDHLLVIHGSDDETVPLENAHFLFQMARNPKKKLILQGGDHRISDVRQQETFIAQSVDWFQRCFKSFSGANSRRSQ